MPVTMPPADAKVVDTEWLEIICLFSTELLRFRGQVLGGGPTGNFYLRYDKCLQRARYTVSECRVYACTV